MSGALQAGTEGMGIGEEISGVAHPSDGLIDEIRVSTVVHSDALAQGDVAQPLDARELPVRRR